MPPAVYAGHGDAALRGEVGGDGGSAFGEGQRHDAGADEGFQLWVSFDLAARLTAKLTVRRGVETPL
jgi:hypothetical protein